MKTKDFFRYLISGFIVLTTESCLSETTNESTSNRTAIHTIQKNLTIDTFKIRESFDQTDASTSQYLIEKLTPIRKNFAKINSIQETEWSKKETKYLEGTNEGGEASYYYWNDELSKIITKEYGETFQVLTEYYLLNGKVSFVFEKILQYNRPIYYDSTVVKGSIEKEVFNIDKSEIEENRNYFDKGKLIHQLSNQDCGSPFADSYLQEEQTRILKKFDKLIKFKN